MPESAPFRLVVVGAFVMVGLRLRLSVSDTLGALPG